MFIYTLTEDPILFFRIVAIVIFSITLHELAHGWAAISQGDDTPSKAGHLTLNPVVHMGWQSIIFLCISGIAWGQMPVNPSKFRSAKLGNILVSAAGPLSNLVLGILFTIVIRLYYNEILPEFLSVEFIALAARINLTLFLFNLLPIPPLDGFHVFSEIIPPLKVFGESQYSIFGLMILFMIPGLGEGLSEIASMIMGFIIGV